MSKSSTSPMGLFERYLSVWVALCILAGLILGVTLPGLFQAIAGLEYANVNLVVAVFIWVMIYPMMAVLLNSPAGSNFPGELIQALQS